MPKTSQLTPDSTFKADDELVFYDPSGPTTKRGPVGDLVTYFEDEVLPQKGWESLNEAPDTITALGNRSYSVVFNGVDLTGITSPGMRLKLPRTSTAPIQCANLEASSSQYFSKTSPTGLSFTTTFTCSAWIKLESYTEGGIIARRNADTEGWSLEIAASGQVSLGGYRIASNNKTIVSYQSLPLNKWVHVAATMDMAVGDTSAQKIWLDGVEVPRLYTLTGTASALVQGTTALVVGAAKSAGTNPLDGKIAQAAVFSSQLSDATIKAMANQTMTGAESTVCAAYTLSNSLLDLTANDNDLTASGSALATDTDTPFTNPVTGTSVIAGTTNYGIVMAQTFSTNTTLTVQIPEGETLPTTGGIGTVSYSTQKTPYGFPGQRGKWRISSLLKGDMATAFGGTATWYITNFKITAPIGCWGRGFQVNGMLTSTVSGTREGDMGMYSAAEVATPATAPDAMSCHMYENGSNYVFARVSGHTYDTLSAETAYYMYGNIQSSTGSESFYILKNSELYLDNGYL